MATNQASNLPETGEEWLRLLVREPLYLFPEGVHCSGCGSFIPTGGSRCSFCGGRCAPIDWRSINRKIKRELRTRKGILGRVKDDYENLFSPEQSALRRGPDLTGALEWLVHSWKRARRPKGRSFGAWRYFRLLYLFETISALKRTSAYRKGIYTEMMDAVEYLEGLVIGECSSWKEWESKSGVRRKFRIKKWGRKYRRDPGFRLRGGRIEGY